MEHRWESCVNAGWSIENYDSPRRSNWSEMEVAQKMVAEAGRSTETLVSFGQQMELKRQLESQ